MALTFAHKLWETTNVWSTTVGSADLPASAGVGDFRVGDMVINIGAATGGVWGWACVAATGNPLVTLSWAAISLLGADGAGSVRFVTAAATAAAADAFIETVSACTITLPTTYPAAKPISVIAGATTTVAPASGTIVIQGTAGTTQAAVTLSAVQHGTWINDSTNWVLIG